MSQKRKLTSYTIEQRYKVLTLLDKGEKASKIAKEYGIPKNNISTWNKPENREKIVKEYEAGAVDSKRKRFREGKYSDIENVFDALTVLEDYALQQQITRKTKQTKITELFDNMIKKENN